jgi:peptide-methionine (R)-S-oxide reductase
MTMTRGATKRAILGATVLAGFAFLLGVPRRHAAARVGTFAVTHSDAEWHRLLSPDAFDVLRDQGTEAPFSSPLDHEVRPGVYDCAGCALPLYGSATKYDSGTGWPSFWAPIKGGIATADDSSFAMDRTEVHCSRCGGHLGHVFTDGPQPTGLRYCMNGLALSFHPIAAT